MVSVLNGTIDDGYGGMLGWFWVACAVTTIGLVVVTRAALQGAVLLGGDGGHRPAVPGDPHRVRHRSGGPGRPRRLIARVAGAVRRGGRTGAKLGEAARPPVRRPGPSSCGGAVRKRSAAITLCVETLRNCNEGLGRPAPTCGNAVPAAASPSYRRRVTTTPAPAPSAAPDPAEVGAFAFTVANQMAGAVTAAMVHLGDRLGLFRALADAGESLTTGELADRTGLVERWVREWAYNQAAAGLVVADTGGPVERFSLTPAAVPVLVDEIARDEPARHVPPAPAEHGAARRRPARELPHRHRPRLRHARTGGRGRGRARLRAVDAQPPRRRSDPAPRRRGRAARRPARRPPTSGAGPAPACCAWRGPSRPAASRGTTSRGTPSTGRPRAWRPAASRTRRSTTRAASRCPPTDPSGS